MFGFCSCFCKISHVCYRFTFQSGVQVHVVILRGAGNFFSFKKRYPICDMVHYNTNTNFELPPVSQWLAASVEETLISASLYQEQCRSSGVASLLSNFNPCALNLRQIFELRKLVCTLKSLAQWWHQDAHRGKLGSGVTDFGFSLYTSSSSLLPPSFSSKVGRFPLFPMSVQIMRSEGQRQIQYNLIISFPLKLILHPPLNKFTRKWEFQLNMTHIHESISNSHDRVTCFILLCHCTQHSVGEMAWRALNFSVQDSLTRVCCLHCCSQLYCLLSSKSLQTTFDIDRGTTSSTACLVWPPLCVEVCFHITDD